MKKPKEFKKRKLSLNKDAVAALNAAQMGNVMGGGTCVNVHTCGGSCAGTNGCPTPVCPTTPLCQATVATQAGCTTC